MPVFMNQHEITNAMYDYLNHPVLGPATRTLGSLQEAANRHSDGWAYWPKPSRAARRLMELIGTRRTLLDNPDRDDATPAAYRKALAPIKAFRTRHPFMDFEIEEIES